MMRVHLHTVCWNDMAHLEFFFRHYTPWVDHFWIHDDGSTDGSLELLAKRNDVTVVPLKRQNAESWVLSAKAIYDTSWMQSRGIADWVIVTNIDEHLYHPNMPEYLTQMRKDGVTAIPALGYQMIARDMPSPDSTLSNDVPFGAPWKQMSKLQIFRPDTMERSDFAPGRHSVQFDGTVIYPEHDVVLNLHYKYLGLEDVKDRHAAQAERLKAIDLEKGWGHKYHWSFESLKQDFEGFEQALVDIHEHTDHHTSHKQPRWWR
jgi:hypothetical protein